MKIEIPDGKFEKLIKLVFLGNWVVNSEKTWGGEDPRIEEYDEIEEALLKLAYENGFKELVSFDMKAKKYFPSQALEFDGDIQNYLDDYNDANFWQDLSSRLAERDVIEKLGTEKFLKLDNKEGFILITKAEDKYIEEFEENGIDNLRIVSKPSSGK